MPSHDSLYSSDTSVCNCQHTYVASSLARSRIHLALCTWDSTIGIPMTIDTYCAQVALRILEAAKAVNAAQFVLVSPSGGSGGGGFLGNLFGGIGLNASKVEQARDLSTSLAPCTMLKRDD